MDGQYIHKLSYVTGSTGGEWDEENGGYTPVTPGQTVTVECRAVPNGAGKQIQNQDGTMVTYGYDIAFPVDTTPIQRYTEVKVFGLNGSMLTSGPLLNYHQGELHGRGWV